MGLQAVNNLDETIARYQADLAQQPDNVELLIKLAETYQAQGQLNEAIAHYQKVLQFKPHIAEVYFNLGTIYFTQNRLLEVADCFRKAIALKPDYADAYCNLGATLFQLGQLDEAIASYRQAITINPKHAEAYCYLATFLAVQNNFTEAIKCFETALAIKSDYVEARCHLGDVWAEQGKLTEAIACYHQAISLNPNYAHAHFGLSMALLAQGDFAEGLKEYEWRWKLKEFSAPSFSQPMWDGSSLQGKTILLCSEQGLGDVLQFIRYIPLVAKHGGKIIFACPVTLVRLINQIKGISKVIPHGSSLPAFDIYANLLSLPRILGTTLETIPSEVPYLKAIRDNLNVLTAPANTKLKIGFVWSSGYRKEAALFRMYAKKSCALSFFLDWQQKYPDICMYSLQVGKDALELQPWLSNCLQDLSGSIQDFADTADLVDQLDLIISVDTSVAHLAGAMGKPVWVLLPFTSDWRWLLDRTDSPWYPTMHLFRQSQPDDWSSVFTQVHQALATILAPKYYQQARDFFQQGNLIKAIATCETTVKLQPNFGTGYISLGHMQQQAGQIEQAIANYQTAITLQPNAAEAYLGMVNLLHKQNRQEEANSYRQKLAEISFQEANACLQSKESEQLNQAVTKYQTAINNKSNFLEAYINLSVVLRRLGRLDEAINYLEQAIQLRPDSADTHYNLANIFSQQGRDREAIISYQTALKINPNFVNACFNLATALEKQELWTEAINLYQRAIAINPHYISAYCNLGIALMQEKQLEQAISYFQKALELNPNYAEVYINLGLAYTQIGKITDAITCCQKALKINPNLVEAYCNLGFAFMQIEKLPEAAQQFQQAIKLEPNYALAHYNLSHVLLKLGDFSKGWAEHEWRWQVKGLEKPQFSQPMWDGTNLNHQTILLYAEQGFGDVLQFIRYANLVTARGGRVIVQCEASLIPLLQTAPYISQVVSTNDELPSFDMYAPLMSLPYIFGTRLETIPNRAPYLLPPQVCSTNLQLEVSPATKLKVGIVWASGYRAKLAHFGVYQLKSCSLSFFTELLKISGVSLYSLQVGQDRSSLGEYAQESRLQDVGVKLTNFADTSTVIDQLDLVIAVDTSVAHLAGAMAKPVWLLLPFSADWRWLMNRTDSPWYPTMRLFRQQQPGDWESVFAQVLSALQELITTFHTTDC